MTVTYLAGLLSSSLSPTRGEGQAEGDAYSADRPSPRPSPWKGEGGKVAVTVVMKRSPYRLIAYFCSQTFQKRSEYQAVYPLT